MFGGGGGSGSVSEGGVGVVWGERVVPQLWAEELTTK